MIIGNEHSMQLHLFIYMCVPLRTDLEFLFRKTCTNINLEQILLNLYNICTYQNINPIPITVYSPNISREHVDRT